MKLPSIVLLIKNAKNSFLAYPFTIVSAFLMVIVSIYLIEFDYDNITNKFPFINFLLTFALGIPLYFCASLITNNFTVSKYVNYTCSSLFLVLIYFSLPGQETTFNTQVPYIRYAIINLIVHLLVSCILFLKDYNINGFWNFNKTLFIRFCTAILYSVFIYAGIILALTAIHLLFNIPIKSKRYGEIFVFVFGLFNTWFFVAGIPKKVHVFNNLKKYPNGLKVFTQYILLPLLTVYLLILYSYGSKILISGNWPKGIVAYLITIVSILGILTFLLLYPYGKLKGNEWVKKITLSYYYLLFPLIALLYTAIYIRVQTYGITINRYLINLFGFWITIVAVYFALKKTNIKFIPVSLAILLALSSFGPWGMFQLSENNQVYRLMSILNENSFLRNDTLQQEVLWNKDSLPNFHSSLPSIKTPIINDSIHNEIKSIFDYLDRNHGMNKIAPIFHQDLHSFVKIAAINHQKINKAKIYMETLGLTYRKKYINKSILKNIVYKTSNNDMVNVSGYDFYRAINLYSFLNFTIDSQEYQLKKLVKNKLLFTHQKDSVVVSLHKIVHLLDSISPAGNKKIPNNILQIKTHLNSYDILINLHQIIIEKDSLKIKSINGNLLFKKNNLNP